MEHLKACKTVCEPFAGADIFDCIVEAVVLAMQSGVPVELTHNTTLYVVDPVKIRENILASGIKQ